MNESITNIAIMITEHCNLDCYHCFRHIAHEKSDLDITILSKLAEKIKGTSVNNIRITGGEPLLIKDIHKLIHSFSQHELYTSIGTNGTLLTTQKIKLLKDAGLDEIWVSIHSYNEDIHDKLAGGKGAFGSLVNAIEECQKQGIKIHVNFPVSKYNIKDTLPTLEYLDNIGIDRIKLLRITPIGKACSDNDFEHLDNKEWLELAEKVTFVKFQKSNFKMQGCPPDLPSDGKCTVFPFKHLNLSPSGFVFPCCLLNNRKGMEIGHISELLNDNWESTSKLFSERIKQKYNLKANPIPCLGENAQKSVCPLYSKQIFCLNG